MSALAVIGILFGLAAAFSVGVIAGAWASWCNYMSGWHDGYRYAFKRRMGGRW